MSGGTVYKQRDVVLIPFPYSDLTGMKLRPALIVSNQSVNKSEDRICCLITSQKAKDGIAINAFASGKLPFKSRVKPHRLFTISEKIVKKKLCTVTETFHDAVLARIHAHLKREN